MLVFYIALLIATLAIINSECFRISEALTPATTSTMLQKYQQVAPFFANVEKETLKNTDYRHVVYTSPLMQLVYMSIQPNQEIGKEVHLNHDQFIRIEKGTAKIILGLHDEIMRVLTEDEIVIVPAGTFHNVINISGKKCLKLYTIYSQQG